MNKENLMRLIVDLVSVGDFFKQDHYKTVLWFTTKNPHLGECEPIVFYERNRGHKVTAFIDNQLDENKAYDE